MAEPLVLAMVIVLHDLFRSMSPMHQPVHQPGNCRFCDAARAVAPADGGVYLDAARPGEAEKREERLRGAIDAALNELGVPDENYPAPVANAVDILRAALRPEETKP